MITTTFGHGALRTARMLALALLAVAPAACVVAPYPVAAPMESGFDRSWNAASGAMIDSGLSITQQDRASGTVVGTRGNTEVVGRVLSQADGTTRVEFTTRRGNNEDPGLISRVSAAYQQRMGR